MGKIRQMRIAGHIKEILEHSGFQRYFANTSWLLAEQILRMIVGLFLSVYVARYLGPEKYGIFSYVFAFVALFAPMAKLGLDSIAVRDLVNHPERRDIYLGTAFWLKFAGALMVIGFISIATRFIPNDAATNVFIFIVAGGLVLQSFEVVDFYFQAKVLSKYISVCKLIQLAISTALNLYFVIVRADLLFFILISLVDQFALAVTYCFVYSRQRAGSFLPHFQFRTAVEMVKGSWPILFSVFAIMVYMRIDQIMIKEMLGEASVGIYSAAVKVSEVWYFVPMIIVSSIFPAVINAKKISEGLYYKRIQQLYDLLIWFAVIVAVIMTFFSSGVMTTLYGQAFSGASVVLAVHIWSGIFVGFGVAKGRWMVVENIQMYGLVCTIVGAVVNVLLNLMLIGPLGIKGAAIATCVSYAVASVIVPLFHPKDRYAAFMFLRSLGIKIPWGHNAAGI